MHLNTAARVDPLDQSRQLGAILAVALDCLLDNLDDPLARQTLAAMTWAPRTVAKLTGQQLGPIWS